MIFCLSSCLVDRWILAQKQLRRSLGGCSISLIQAGPFGWARMMNESVEGEADGQRWGKPDTQSLCSAGVVGALLRERRVQTGRELSVQHSCQCSYSSSLLHTWGAARCVFGSLLPLSDCSRLNSALLQCQLTFPLENRYRRISVAAWAFWRGAGLVCRDCGRPFGTESGFKRTAAHTKGVERH